MIKRIFNKKKIIMLFKHKQRTRKNIKKSMLKFEKAIEEKYNLKGKIEFKILDDKMDKESYTYFRDGKCFVHIGIKDYQNINNILDKQWNHIKNTIVHELIHCRNYILLSNETKINIENNYRTLAHFARKILDEYSAYKEANEMYMETIDELNDTEELLFYAFERMYQGIFMKVTPETCYNAFYDNCSAIVVRSILSESFPSLEQVKQECREAINRFIIDLQDAYKLMPLEYNQYEDLGEKIFNDLLIMVPKTKKEIFKTNTGIIFTK